MLNKGKVPSIVLIALILISLSLAGGAFYLLQKEKIKSLALQNELEEAKTREKVTETKLEDSKKTISQLEMGLRELNNQIDFLTGKLQEEKIANREALTQLEQLKVELEEQKKIKADMEEKLTQSQGELKNLQAKLKNLEDKRAELENKIKEIEAAKSQKVELGTIVVGQQESASTAMSTPMDTKMKTSTAPSYLEGKILVINKDYNFAVINLGSKDGVNINDIFSVYHKNKYIGDIKIEKVHDSMSAANFLSPNIKNRLCEGDKVIINNK